MLRHLGGSVIVWVLLLVGVVIAVAALDGARTHAQRLSYQLAANPRKDLLQVYTSGWNRATSPTRQESRETNSGRVIIRISWIRRRCVLLGIEADRLQVGPLDDKLALFVLLVLLIRFQLYSKHVIVFVRVLFDLRRSNRWRWRTGCSKCRRLRVFQSSYLSQIRAQGIR